MAQFRIVPSIVGDTIRYKVQVKGWLFWETLKHPWYFHHREYKFTSIQKARAFILKQYGEANTLIVDWTGK